MKDDNKPPASDFNTDLKLKSFKEYEVECDSNIVRNYSRKIFTRSV